MNLNEIKFCLFSIFTIYSLVSVLIYPLNKNKIQNNKQTCSKYDNPGQFTSIE